MTKVFLIIILYFNGGGTQIYQHEMPGYETCFMAVEKAKLDVSHGDESEAMAIMYCSPTLADKLHYRLQEESK